MKIASIVGKILLLVALIVLTLFIYKKTVRQSKMPDDSVDALAAPYVRKTNPDIPEEAMTAYDRARDAIYESDLVTGEKELKEAVRIKPDFTEAWYNLGATQSRLAIQAMREEKEQEALQHFREGVASKKKSRDLMIANKWYVYNDEEQAQVRADVEKALQDADEVLANESALLAALKIWANH